MDRANMHSGLRHYVRADRVIPATGSGLIHDGVVGVEGSRIVAVGPAGEFGSRLNDHPVHHYPDATILPGMIDAHAHLTLAGDGRRYEQMVADSDEMMALVSARNLQLHLASGVTTLRDNGGRNQVTFIVREATKRGYFPSPRLLLSGRPLTHRMGHFYWCNGTADGPDSMRAAVRELVAEGADHIKIMASGGGTLGNLPYYASYTADELRVIVEAAHGLGRLTAAHCRATQSIVNCLDAGLDCIEHAEFEEPPPAPQLGLGLPDRTVVAYRSLRYDERIADRMVQSGVFLSFTFPAGGYSVLLELRAKQAQEPLTPQEQQRVRTLEEYYDAKTDIFRRFLQAGMRPRMAVSTDAGCGACDFGHLHHGLEQAVEGGLAPIQAIESVTRIAAELCGIAHLTGTLEAGKEADICVVRGDPLDDIHRMADVAAVYRAGVHVGPSPVPLAAVASAV
ncbi:MAG: amidohydrolase family protein [Chloroflexi bacterium]|nr:amidohydrolase family protein [Chloroflexota bacterium]